MKVAVFILAFFGAGFSLVAQNQKELDSLYALLPKMHDTTEVKVLYSIARFEFDRDQEKALKASRQSLAKSRTLNYRNGLVFAYKQIGVFYNLYKNDLDTAELYLDSALALAATNPEKITVYSAFGMVYGRKGDFEKSYTYLMNSLDLIPSKESREAFHAYTYLAYDLSHLGRHREAIQYYKKCLSIAERRNSPRDLGLALSNLGLSYVNQDEYDSALTIYRRLYKFELSNGNPWMNPILLSELGKLYFEGGQRDSAYYFMHRGLRAARELSIPYAITRCLSTLGHYHLLNRPDSALYYGRKLYQQSSKESKIDLEDATYVLAQAHGKLKHFDSAYHYFNKYRVYHDSVFQEKQAREVTALETQFNLKQKQQEIKRLETARQNEVIKRNAFAVGLALSIAVCVLIYVYLRGLVRSRKREIETKNLQLESYTRKIVEKSELVEELRTQLEQFKSEKVIPREKIEHVSQMLQSPILTEDDWEEFKSVFTLVHRDFFAELKLKYPSLSQAETRLAALVKLNLSTREMANVLGISVDSVTKARYRLRKKLELKPQQELSEIFSPVSSAGEGME